MTQNFLVKANPLKKSLISVSSYILLIHSKIAAGFCAHTVTSVAVGHLVGNV